MRRTLFWFKNNRYYLLRKFFRRFSFCVLFLPEAPWVCHLFVMDVERRYKRNKFISSESTYVKFWENLIVEKLLFCEKSYAGRCSEKKMSSSNNNNIFLYLIHEYWKFIFLLEVSNHFVAWNYFIHMKENQLLCINWLFSMYLSPPAFFDVRNYLWEGDK